MFSMTKMNSAVFPAIVFRRSCVTVLGLALMQALAAAATPEPERGPSALGVHMISGSKEYGSAKSLPAFKEYLEGSIQSWTAFPSGRACARSTGTRPTPRTRSRC
jgi:hypothetical protein